MYPNANTAPKQGFYPNPAYMTPLDPSKVAPPPTTPFIPSGPSRPMSYTSASVASTSISPSSSTSNSNNMPNVFTPPDPNKRSTISGPPPTSSVPTPYSYSAAPYTTGPPPTTPYPPPSTPYPPPTASSSAEHPQSQHTAPPAMTYTTTTAGPNLSSLPAVNFQQFTQGGDAQQTSGRTSAPAASSFKQSSSRINPAQIPSPTNVDYPKYPLKYYTATTSVPPSVLSNYVAIDEGNCSPRFIRMSLYNIPTTKDLLNQSHLPLAAIVQPLADVIPGELAIPIVDFGPSGPIRCHRCRAYINPLAKFVNGGRQYVCRFCDYVNDVPDAYYCPLDHQGRRQDYLTRPELSRGTVEFVATAEYIQRPPLPLAYLFAIDVSYNAVASGMLAMVVEKLRSILTALPESNNNRFGFVTYDTSIHFYNLSPALQQPQMVVVPDVNEVFSPFAEEHIFVKYHESKSNVDMLLEKLETLFTTTKASESAMGSALQAGIQALKSTGGKILCFQSNFPGIGAGALKKRDDPRLIGTEKERSLYGPQTAFYQTLGAEAVKSAVCVDMFLFPYSYLDVATLSGLTKATGGQIYYYPNFKVSKESHKFYADLYRNIQRATGYDAMMRIRTSRGITIASHSGNFSITHPNELDLAGIDSDKSIAVHLIHDDKLDTKSEPGIQSALLYTTSNGERRIRVQNLGMTCTDVLGTLFKSADCETVLNFMTRQAIQGMEKPSGPSFNQIRNQLVEQCIEILYVYRKFCATSTSPGQLILPESLKLLPIYSLAIIKNAALRSGADLHTDDRAFVVSLLNALPPQLSIPFTYPRMYSLHDLPEEYGIPDQDGFVTLPPAIRVSAESLVPEGAFLLETGQEMYFWLGKNLEPSFVRDIFGYETSVDNLNCSELVLGALDNEFSQQVVGIVNAINQRRGIYQRLTVLKQGDPAELRFFSYLVEDKAQDTMSYVDFLCHVHKQIQVKLS
eukprot:TRINITY_DN1833_c0_g1_i1.p1 TRINITY_DN1833_c0_g1~~TRINITY_DN1833_c0_g1_i1.p1  ORF type:complete len:964 (-),score=245.41 TRINITY_DN1833_c0_g1_i1:62-2953(-)